MDKQGNQHIRHLAPLKMVSRLLGHEMHAQGTASAISLSREELGEIRATIDLFIEEATRRSGAPGSGMSMELPTAGDPSLVPARN